MKNVLFLLAASAGLFTLANTACAGPFLLSDVVTNSNPSVFIVAGDLNGDGKPDLVSVNNNYTFTVATNAGNGIFVPNVTYSYESAGFPLPAAIADVNGDGKPDIILINSAQSTVVIFTNAGGGIFASNAAYSVGGGPAYVVAQDINGDGKPDIITANSFDGTLTILTNAGGTFRLSQTALVVNTNSMPYNVAVADINGDGKPDLIVGDSDDALIEVLTNAGGGIFVSNAVYAAGAGGAGGDEGPAWVVAADFNNDGKMDIASANFDGSVTILTNAGNGILARSQSFIWPIGDGIPEIIAADVDGDGYTDLLVNGQIGNTRVLETLFNSGSGGIFITNYLNLPNSINTITAPVYFGSFVFTDTNSYGRPNLAGVNGYIYAFTNGIGSFPNSISINVYSNLNSAPVTNILAQATSSSGAVVNFTTTATNWTGSWPVTNAPPSGSVFPIGTTMVTASTGYHLTSVVSAQTNTTFTVTVVDTQSPVITLLGANPGTNFVDHYIDPGATATDPVYGNLTGSIIVSGDLNTNAPGTYTVTYSVTNPSGDNAMTNRTVVIIPVPPLGVASAVGNQAAIFWPPGSDTNYVLQTTTNLASGNWVNVTNSAPLMGVFVTNSSPAAFFRLEPQ